MLRISQMKIRTGHTREAFEKKLLGILHIKKEALISYKIVKQSLDARKKPELFYVYTVDVKVKKENAVLKSIQKKKGSVQISLCTEEPYHFPESGNLAVTSRPVIVGSGPAGLFCAYFLALYGYRPILIEQGAPVDERKEDVEKFWETGILKPYSNVQFGEGGAGTFSDGKLNTLVKDPNGRIQKVLEIFTEHGAPAEILYVNKPHVGTDILADVVKNIRKKIISLGAEVCFYTKMTSILVDEETSRVKGILIRHTDKPDSREQVIETDTVVLALGHSARDTFEMLYNMKIPMEAKAFAVGVRVEHPQEMINESQYGTKKAGQLGSAPYKLTEKLSSGRGVYSFCMCPGGYVVNASSEEGKLAVNGMSYHARDSKNANSAIVVTVTPEDYGSTHPLAGIAFQRRLEKAAYETGKGKIPVQRFDDFCHDKASVDKNHTNLFAPCMKGSYTFTNLRPIFPEFVSRSLIEGIKKFNVKIRGFSSPDTILSAVESRTSSPVRIVRNENYESCFGGLYPCGEGAGYAGGITSAAVDGIKIAEAICRKYASFDKNAPGLRKI